MHNLHQQNLKFDFTKIISGIGEKVKSAFLVVWTNLILLIFCFQKSGKVNKKMHFTKMLILLFTCDSSDKRVVCY